MRRQSCVIAVVYLCLLTMESSISGTKRQWSHGTTRISSSTWQQIKRKLVNLRGKKSYDPEKRKFVLFQAKVFKKSWYTFTEFSIEHFSVKRVLPFT